MNNSFEQCIANICGLEVASLATGKYTVFGNKVAVVEGHNGIVDYSPNSILFAFGKGQLQICGQNLRLKCLERHYCVVCGKVCSVAVKNG